MTLFMSACSTSSSRLGYPSNFIPPVNDFCCTSYAMLYVLSHRHNFIDFNFARKNVTRNDAGKALPWLWVTLLPFIDENRLKDALDRYLLDDPSIS
jgi:hypothetical protein